MSEVTLNDTAHKILDAAEFLTQTKGFNDFSYKDLQQEVGIKTSSIHYYFPTKQHLAVSMSSRYVDRFMNTLAEIDSRKMGAAKKLESLGKIFIEGSQLGKLCLCGMLSADIAAMPSEVHRNLDRFFSEAEQWIGAAISQGIEDEEFSGDINPKSAAAHFLATLEGAILISRSRKGKHYLAGVLSEALTLLKR